MRDIREIISIIKDYRADHAVIKALLEEAEKTYQYLDSNPRFKQSERLEAAKKRYEELQQIEQLSFDNIKVLQRFIDQHNNERL